MRIETGPLREMGGILLVRKRNRRKRHVSNVSGKPKKACVSAGEVGRMGTTWLSCVRRAVSREIRVFEPRVRRDLFCVRGRVQFDNLWCQGKSFPAGIPEETALLVFKSNGVPTPPLLLWSLDEPGLTRLRLQEIRLFPTRTRSQHDA